MEIAEDCQITTFHYIKQKIVNEFCEISKNKSINMIKELKKTSCLIIASKCPYRISLLGGSTDLDWFIRKHHKSIDWIFN